MVPSFYVYVHSRLSNGEPFYVGKGHSRRSHTHKSRSAHWKNIVAKDGGFHANLIAKNMDEELAFLIEMEAIDKYRRVGVKLINLTNGGDGVSGYRNPKGAHNKGKPCSEEMKARISATNKAKGLVPPIGWNRGLSTPEEIVEKMRSAQLARWAKVKQAGGIIVSAETREKQRAAKIGRQLSTEHRRKLSVSLKANKFVRVHPDMKGFVHSAETRAKMSESAKRRCARGR
jgi:hypothetical protein